MRITLRENKGAQSRVHIVDAISQPYTLPRFTARLNAVRHQLMPQIRRNIEIAKELIGLCMLKKHVHLVESGD